MAKTYFLQFGFGDSRTNTGLAPTFLIFANAQGSGFPGPGITEIPTGTGIYSFTYGVTSPIAFLADGFTTGLGSGRYIVGSIDPNNRSDEYGNTLIAFGNSLIALGNSNVALGTTNVAIGLSNIALGVSNVALGNSNIALGTTNVAVGLTNLALNISQAAVNATFIGLLGDTSSSFGSTSIDPTTVFGFLKRAQEMAEGNQTYTKATGLLDFYSRGSSTLLREKTVSDTSSNTTKT